MFVFMAPFCAADNGQVSCKVYTRNYVERKLNNKTIFYVIVKKNNEDDLEEEMMKPEKGRRSYENGWTTILEWIIRISERILKFGEFLEQRAERT